MPIKTTKINNMPAIITDDILVFNPKTSLSAYANTLSGSFTYPSGKTPCSIMINNGKDIFSSACHAWLGYPETVIYRYKDGNFGIGKYKTTSEIPNRTNILWAVGGLGLLDKYNPNEEGFCSIIKEGKTYDYSDVLRKTNHTVLGIKNSKCYLVYCTDMTGSQVNDYAKKCDFKYAIMMDGGHIAAINGSESYAKINTKQIQGYALQGISTSNGTNNSTNQSTIPTPPPTKTNYKIALDSGHSKVVSGKRSPDGKLLEYEFNMDVCKRIQKHLERHGVESKIFQVENTNLTAELNERIRLINNYNPTISVSIHANAHGNGSEWTSANGWELFYYTGSTNGLRLAKEIHTATVPLGLTDRGIKTTSSLAMVKRPKAPAVLVEHAFMTNKADCDKLKSNAWRDKFAIADTKGILKYLGVKWVELGEEPKVETVIKPDTNVLYKVQTGAFGNKDNAEKLKSELESKGYSTLIKEEKK